MFKLLASLVLSLAFVNGTAAFAESGQESAATAAWIKSTLAAAQQAPAKCAWVDQTIASALKVESSELIAKTNSQEASKMQIASVHSARNVH